MEAKPIAAFDLDGTLYKTSMLDAVYEQASSENIIDELTARRVHNANETWQYRHNNEGTYTRSVGLTISALINTMKGREPEVLTDLATRAAKNAELRKRSFVHESMKLLSGSHEIVIISASNILITNAFLEQYGMETIPKENIYGSTWEVVDGKFTGNGTTLDKVSTIENIVKDHKARLGSRSVAFGDTISDFGMLKLTEIGFMVNPSAALEKAANGRLHKINESKDTISHTLPGSNPPFRHFPLQSAESILKSCRII